MAELADDDDLYAPVRTGRRARVLAWLLIAAFVLPIVLGLLASALGWV